MPVSHVSQYAAKESAEHGQIELIVDTKQPSNNTVILHPNMCIRQRNDLIFSRQNLNNMEKRLVSCCIANINPNVSELDIDKLSVEEYRALRTFEIYVNDIISFYEYKKTSRGAVYRDLAITCNSLWNKSEHLYLAKDEHVLTRWVETIKYKSGSGYITLTFADEIFRHMIIDFVRGNYSAYSLKIGTMLKSVYSTRVFEILQVRSDINKYTITLERFCALLNLPSSYSYFRKIEKKVLEVVAREFKAFYNINFSWKKYNKSNTVYLDFMTDHNVNDLIIVSIDGKDKIKLKDKENRAKVVKNNNYDAFVVNI